MQVNQKDWQNKITTIVVFCLILSPTIAFFHGQESLNTEFDSISQKNIIPNSDIPEIVFDESHKQWWSLWDTGFIGYSDLAILLWEEGYKVSTNSGDLAATCKNLEKGDVLVLGMTSSESYTQGEIDSIIDFVHRGGGLLAIGEHEMDDGGPWYLNVMQNTVSSHFGIQYNEQW